ncbi:adenylate kinase [Halogranum amylolyticum]|uniref:Putative adenylate kinase n=1 Tax=Halogranum amylolyticum TaxID=660520 RepID=A0A1H8SI91_9EURY|nr:adenylate kinase family protein [Halogranum amylolyticum]SEO77893.1 adenylate kinase [Halogranum amylolyticum]
MRVVVTGTPGTGKTTAVDALETEERIVHLNDAIRDHELWTERDADRDTLVTDLDAVREWLGDWDGLVESHLAHHLDADKVVVLRCRPDVLEERLRERGESETKAKENAESEALDVILSEAVEFHGEESVYEIDTTDRTPEAVAAEIRAVLDDEREPSAGTVNFLDYL